MLIQLSPRFGLHLVPQSFDDTKFSVLKTVSLDLFLELFRLVGVLLLAFFFFFFEDFLLEAFITFFRNFLTFSSFDLIS